MEKGDTSTRILFQSIDSTIHYLNKAYNEKDILLVGLKGEPTYDRIREDPGFKELLRKMELSRAGVNNHQLLVGEKILSRPACLD